MPRSWILTCSKKISWVHESTGNQIILQIILDKPKHPHGLLKAVTLCIIVSTEAQSVFPNRFLLGWGGRFTCHFECVGIRGQLWELRSLLPSLHGFQGSNSSPRLQAKPSFCWVIFPSFKWIKNTVGVRRFVYSSVQLPLNKSSRLSHKVSAIQMNTQLSSPK